MDVRRISRSELLAAAGGALLAISVFLPWYSANPDNPNANINGMKGMVSAWDAHTILRYLFLVVALAPLILLYIVMRDHQLSWPRGEMTAVVGIAAFGLIGYTGLLDRPGDPSGEISLSFGWFMAMAGVILMMVGGAWRAGGTERPRKPPGVL